MPQQKRQNGAFMEQHDLIAAIATPRGRGGIAVIRISGAGAGTLMPK